MNLALQVGNPDVHGLCQALVDWSAELRLIKRLPWKKKSCNS
jgi:hypothetical protein